MKTLPQLVLIALATVILFASPLHGQDVRVSIDDSRVVTMRLEIFDAASERIFDSGPIVGQTITVTVDELSAAAESLADQGGDADPFSYELRGWDVDGRLVVSQLATVPEDVDPISTISFDTIPPNTLFGAAQITMAGDVVAQQDLTVQQSLRTDELRKTNGANFFGSCASGSSIRTIGVNGAVTCQPDTSGGDNLGNHVATQNLDMGSHTILFDTNTDLLRTAGNARLKTGGLGHTLMIKGGQPPGADIAQFRNLSDEIKIRINSEGRLMFTGGQKICSVFTGTWRSSLLVSDGWTSSTCANYQNLIASEGNYQLFCLFDNGYSFGTPGGGVPSNNCGW